MHFVPNLYDFLSSVEYKGRFLVESCEQKVNNDQLQAQKRQKNISKSFTQLMYYIPSLTTLILYIYIAYVISLCTL